MTENRDRPKSERLASTLRELKLAARALARSPGFAIATVVTLGLGIGATASIYTLLDAVVLRPLPYPAADRLVHLSSRVPLMDADAQWGLSEAGYHHFREHATTLDELAVVGNAFAPTAEATVTGESGAERVRLVQTSASAFDVLGLSPARGRLFREEEERPGAAPVAILSEEYWQRRYGGEDVLGRQIVIAAVSFEIIGVMRRGAHLPNGAADVWLPFNLDPSRPAVNSHFISAIGRLAPGATAEQAQAELGRMTARFPEIFPEQNAYGGGFVQNSGFYTRVASLHADVVGAVSRTLWVLLGAVAVVLLIAAANVANLFLVRIESRRREVALRSALGAGRGDLAVHHLGESMLVAAGAAALALLFAHVAMRAMVALAPPGFPRLLEVSLTSGAVALAIGTAVLAGLIFGLVPLLQSDASAQTLREGGKGMTASRSQRAIRSGLVVAQTALALVLMTAAGLMLQSFVQLRSVDLGFQTDDALTFQLPLPPAEYQGWEPVFEFHRQVVQRIEALPGVTAAGVTTGPPMPTRLGCSSIFVEGRALQPVEQPPCVPTLLASPDAFAALGMTLHGAPSDWTEMWNRAGGAVVTRTLADQLWPGEDPMGKGIRGNGPNPPFYRVVAVTEPVRLAAVDEPATPAVYFPMLPIEGAGLWSPPYNPTYVVRTSGVAPLAMVEPIRRLVAGIDANIPMAQVETLHTRVENTPSMTRASFTLILLVVAGSIALLLSAVGIFAVISYIVAHRTREIGVRLALGAQPASVRTMVVRQSLTLVGAGLLVGVVAAVAGTQVLQSLLFEVSATNPLIMASVAFLLIVTAAAASYLPAHRAASVPPGSVLRED
jgi:putative ABC transport system permease protein